MTNLERVENIYVLGSTIRDEITRVKTRFSDHLTSDQRQGVNFTTAIDFEYSCLGGTGINIARNLRQFCDKDIYLFSVVGVDNEDVLNTLASHRINPHYLQTRSGHSTSKAMSEKNSFVSQIMAERDILSTVIAQPRYSLPVALSVMTIVWVVGIGIMSVKVSHWRTSYRPFDTSFTPFLIFLAL